MHARKVFYRLDELDELKKAAGIHAGKPPPFRGEKDEAKYDILSHTYWQEEQRKRKYRKRNRTE